MEPLETTLEPTDAAERVRKAREMYDKTVAKTDGRDDAGFYLVVVFKTQPECEAFVKAIGCEDDRFDVKFIDGKYLTAKLGAAGPDVELG